MAVIVSHGQPSEPDPPEAELAGLARQVAALLPGRDIRSATLAKPGALDAVLADAGPAPLIYPLFMTDGWFTRSALPKRVGNPAAHILAPFGADPSLPALARDILAETLAGRGWRADDTCLVIAAHGSGRSRNSARATEAFAEALAALLRFREVRLGYVEEPPYLGDVVFDTGAQAICLPFFAASGGHVQEDLPEALNLAGFPGARLDPLGIHARVPQLIAAALARAMQEQAA
ncbi:CbiX/SirB N-terminal domain-containing protein [Pukyongiella litopenaei]|uniref:CbiX/SirB N-terminal domain-containing protein n=1 Tax=Pukyongiella litopenaei TaxID=2605946 RepID=UPI001FCE8BBB|nr:CbiX/SirB N-terminal domain-containing protein [Pukyongiella litopenaei]